jgi:hypothetical protein
LWLVFLVLFGLRALRLGIPDSFNLWFIGLVLGVLGLLLGDERDGSGSLSRNWVFAALVFAVAVRVIPYLDNRVPLGIDAGLYKALFERPQEAVWSGIYPLPFTLLMYALTRLFGFTFVDIPIFITITSLTSVALYYAARRLFGQTEGVAGAFLFAVSVTQFDLFQLNYYKNAFGIILLVLALPTLEGASRPDWRLILAGTLIAGMHQLALAVFGLAYALHWLLRFRQTTWRERGWVAANGLMILALAFLTNFDRWQVYLFGQGVRFLGSVAEVAGGGTENAGQYLDTIVYLNFNAPLLALALPGFREGRRSRALVVAALVLAGIILFKLFFYRRFLIYLDILLILFAGLGWLQLYFGSRRAAGSPRWGRWTAVALLVLMAAQVANRALETVPVISEGELTEIDALDTIVPPGANLITLDPKYGTWAVGWTEFNVIAPTMFNDDYAWADWQSFRRAETDARLGFLAVFPRPLYILISLKDANLEPFAPECFHGTRLENFEVLEITCGE